MSEVVLDASAVLAMIFMEPGGERLSAALEADEPAMFMSAVNYCEVLSKLIRNGDHIDGQTLAPILQNVEVVPFLREDTEFAASLTLVRGALSLGDRICLTLARELGATVWTADRVWAGLDCGVDVELIR